MDQPKVIIFRGPPGSGKSTAARTLYPGRLLLEADMYWEEREFNPKYLSEAHEWCLETAKLAYANGVSFCVANTFTRRWEVELYIEAFNPVIYRCTGEFQNVHNVPDTKVQKMRDRMEDIEGEKLWIPYST